jgi:tRNA 2-thiouridine synthesizing protein A
MIEVDARGLSCPIPVVKAKQAIDKGPEEFCVLVDAYVQVENVTRLIETKGYRVNVEEEDGSYKITATKGAGNA